MDIVPNDSVQHDPWQSLRAFTAARIALGATGTAIPLKETLEFRLAHAFARDAVYSALDTIALEASLAKMNMDMDTITLQSQAINRQQYLQRPDLGRKLHTDSLEQLEGITTSSDIAIILADGLSATAINHHAIPVLQLLIPSLQANGYSLTPIVLTEQARVAIGDEIGERLRSTLSIVFIGERPGLSSPDSMGVYLTYQPSVGLTDERRNCISNIRPEGLIYSMAANKILYLIRESMRLKLSGTRLKDNDGLIE